MKASMGSRGVLPQANYACLHCINVLGQTQVQERATGPQKSLRTNFLQPGVLQACAMQAHLAGLDITSQCYKGWALPGSHQKGGRPCRRRWACLAEVACRHQPSACPPALLALQPCWQRRPEGRRPWPSPAVSVPHTSLVHQMSYCIAQEALTLTTLQEPPRRTLLKVNPKKSFCEQLVYALY